MLNSKPLIALTASTNYVATKGLEPRQFVLTKDYTHAIALAGGIPFIVSEECPEEIVQICDGLLLTGGPDVAPERYGAAPLDDSVQPDPERDQFEMALLHEWMKSGKPVMGICRGSQVLNVYFGGTLLQNLELESGWSHRDWDVRHLVYTEPGSILYRLFGKEFLVNTIHHQAVDQMGAGLKVTARSPAGIVEAYEHTSLPVFAVQFHPEKMANRMCDGSTKDFQPIFQYFVDMVRTHMGK